MKIHINRAGQPLGQFTPDEVRAGFKDGKFNATDLAWRDGMPMWKPLGEVIDEIAPETAVDSGGSVPPDVVPVAQATGFPWEEREQRGFLNALVETVRMVLLEPTAAFQRMPLVGGLGGPLFFAVAVGSTTLFINLLFQQLFGRLSSTADLTAEQQQAFAFMQSSLYVGLAILLIPLFVAFAVLFTGVLTHLCLILVGGARRPLETTLRVIAYASGATAVLELLPVCGTYFVAPIWRLIVSAIGLSQAHGISSGKAALALVLPALFCCVIPALMVIFVILVAMGVKLGAG